MPANAILSRSGRWGCEVSEQKRQSPDMLSLQRLIAKFLIEIENDLKDRGLPVDRMTLIARDRSNDEMFVMVTNETDAGVRKAFKLAERWEKK